MLRLDKEVDNILLLKKQIKYELSHKGGAQKTKNFVDNVINKNKEFIGLSFYITNTIIIYLILCKCFPYNYNSVQYNNQNYMVGGLNSTDNVSSSILATISKVVSFAINAVISGVFGFAATPILTLYVIFSILLLILILFLILIIDFGLYVPCGGCQPDGRYLKCIPGTGKNSLTCSAITNVLKIISAISKVLTKIKNQIRTIKRKIKSGLYTLVDLLKIVKEFLIDILGFPLDILNDFFNFMKFLNIGNWGFNLGGLLIGGNDKNAIYDKSGKLKDKHGSNIFLQMFFKIVRILLETPKVPKLEWPSFGGAQFEPKVDPDSDPNNQEPVYPIEEPDITTDGAEVKKADVPVPDASDYNKYETDIDSNEVTEPGQNEAVEGTNLKEKMRLKKIAAKKAKATDKLIGDTNKTLEGIKGKKQRVKFIIKKMEETRQIIDDLIAEGKVMLDNINNIHRPDFAKIAKLGSIVGEGQSDPAEIKLEAGQFVLYNMWEEDMTVAQKKSFKNLNNKMAELNNNTEKIEIYKITLLEYGKQLEIENNKIGDYANDMKDFLYMKFLEMLIQIDINPLLWITQFVNLILIKPVNAAIQIAIIKPIIKLVKIVFKLAKKIYKAIVGEVYKMSKYILIPLYKAVDAFKPILKVFYRVLSIINNIGIFNMIFYYFYDMVEQAFSFIKNVFLLLFITIIICSVLIGCPVLGGYYELYLFSKSFGDSFITFSIEIGYNSLIQLWNYQASIGPFLTNIYVQIIEESVDYLSDVNKNTEKLVKRIGFGPFYIIVFIIFCIIIGIITFMYLIYRHKLLQKFIVNNTISLKQKILNKNKKDKKK